MKKEQNYFDTTKYFKTIPQKIYPELGKEAQILLKTPPNEIILELYM